MSGHCNSLTLLVFLVLPQWCIISRSLHWRSEVTWRHRSHLWGGEHSSIRRCNPNLPCPVLSCPVNSAQFDEKGFGALFFAFLCPPANCLSGFAFWRLLPPAGPNIAESFTPSGFGREEEPARHLSSLQRGVEAGWTMEFSRLLRKPLSIHKCHVWVGSGRVRARREQVATLSIPRFRAIYELHGRSTCW